jgi:small subunit ribosomal protein S1
MDEDGEKINLSIKALMDNPWDRVEAQVGDVVKAKVLGTNKGGVEVATDLGVDGFIPKSEALSYDDRNKDVSSFFAKDDEVEAKIIEIDPKQWRMVLSIRKINEDKARADLEKYNDSEEVSTNIGDKLK